MPNNESVKESSDLVAVDIFKFLLVLLSSGPPETDESQ